MERSELTLLTCYCCDAPAVGKGDHVPPLSFFQIGTFANVEPILVPSCLAHNQKQSAADEYLKFVLTSSAARVPTDAFNSTIRGVIRQIEKNSKNLDRFGVERNGDQVSIDGSSPVDLSLLTAALEKIARGIYFHHSGGVKLIGDLRVSPIFLGIDPSSSHEVRRSLTTLEDLFTHDLRHYGMHGEFQEVFSYQVIESPGLVTINMIFYGEKRVSVMRVFEESKRGQ